VAAKTKRSRLEPGWFAETVAPETKSLQKFVPLSAQGYEPGRLYQRLGSQMVNPASFRSYWKK